MAGQSQAARVSEPTPTDEPRRSGGLRTPIQQHPDLVAGVIVAMGFVWRLWRAQATFFNTDEAWHFSLANQNSLAAAYRASLTLVHPPLLIFVLYYWRHLGTSNLVLRLPSVLAGTLLCWVFYKWLSRVFGRGVGWVGLIFITFLPPWIALSAELRQYPLMLLFVVASACLLEGALARNSVGRMIGSSLCLYLAMFSHYSAFLFAAAVGIYAILKMILERPRRAVVATWTAGQVVGAGLAAFFYFTHISSLGGVYAGAEPLHNFADWYLSDWYFHAGRDHLLPFLYRGSFGIFRFAFGQTAVGQLAALLFITGVCMLVLGRPAAARLPPPSTAVLLVAPFALNWVAVGAGLYPYGRTRQCVYLGLFAVAGVSAALSILSGERRAVALPLALGMVIACQARGTLQGRDMLPLTDQLHQHMDEAVQFIRDHITPGDVIFTDQATSFELRHYLCRQKPVTLRTLPAGFETFGCQGFTVIITPVGDGALTADSLAARWREGSAFEPPAGTRVWVVQGAWATGLGETLRSMPEFDQLEVHSFGRYFEVFQFPQRPAPSPQR